MSTLYFHIGLSKTGSTFLQKEIFPLIESIEYFDKPKLGLVDGKYPWDGSLNRFFRRSPVVWRDFGERLFGELFGPEPKHEQEGDVLISDENACSGRDPCLVAEHLSSFRDLATRWGFTRVCVFGSVRHQAFRMASLYAQISDRRVGASQQDFEAKVRRKIGSEYYRKGFTLEYDLLWRAVVNVIGDENVLLLPYELMKEDLPNFIGRWFTFLQRMEECKHIIKHLRENTGVQPQNVRSASTHTWALRQRTMRGVQTIRLRPERLLGRLGLPTRIPLRWPDLAREDYITLTPGLLHEIMRTYEQSNRALAAHINMDLGPYGYY